jgi:hypothetical protein
MTLIIISLFIFSFQSQAQVFPFHEFLETDFEVVVEVSSFPVGIDTNQVMANPGDEWNETDAGFIGIPSQRLIFAGKSDSICFVYYEQGGFKYSTNLVLFKQNGTVPTTLWAGRLLFKKMLNLNELKSAFTKNANQSFEKLPRSHGIVYLQK